MKTTRLPLASALVGRDRSLVARLGASALLAVALLAAGPALAADTSAGDLAQLRHAVDRTPDDPEAHFELAMGLARTPRVEDAWAELKKVNALDPRFVDRILARYEPLVQQNGSNVEARFRLAFGYYFKGRDFAGKEDASQRAAMSRKAREQFDGILGVDPRYVWAYDYLGYLDAEAGDLAGAEAHWKQAVAVDPNNAVGHFLLGQAYYKRGAMGDAVKEIGAAMRLRSAAALGFSATAPTPAPGTPPPTPTPTPGPSIPATGSVR